MAWHLFLRSIALNNSDGHWVGAIIDLSADPEAGWSVARNLRRTDRDPIRTLVLVSGAQLSELEHRDDLFDDFA